MIREVEDTTNIIIKANINEIYAITEITQSYTNNKENPIELKALFPVKDGIQLMKFTVSIGDKTIVSKIGEKEKAQEKFIDAVASGNTGIYSEYTSNVDYQEVTIGNLAPNETVSMKTEYMQMISSYDMSYEVSLIQNYPCFVLDDLEEVDERMLIGTVTVNTNSKITRLIMKSIDNKYITSKNYSDDYKRCEIEVLYSGNPNNNEYPSFTILFRTENINKPTLYAQYDPSKKETSYVLYYIYSSQSVKEIPIPEKLDEDVDICYYNKYQGDVINDTPSLFIFLIDQSGSMNGKPMELVKNTLKYFIKSLPKKSYFQLIGFGTWYKKYNEKPVEYNATNVENIITINIYYISYIRKEMDVYHNIYSFLFLY